MTVISPGFVESEIRKVDNEGKLNSHAKEPVPHWLLVSAETAAIEIVDAILKRKREQVVTGHGKLLVWLNRFFPSFIRWIFISRVATPSGQTGWWREPSGKSRPETFF
ncbi:MAG: hypothetical protein RJB38_2388 [Pseudomonadota bacterium]